MLWYDYKRMFKNNILKKYVNEIVLSNDQWRKYQYTYIKITIKQYKIMS